MVTGAYHPEITGGGRQCQTLVHALRHSVSLKVLSVSNIPNLSSPDMVDGVTVYRVRVNPARRIERVTAALRLAWGLFCVRNDVDLVHLHGFTQKSILIIGVAKLLRKPLILKLGGVGQDDPGTIRPRDWLFRRSYSMVDRFIAPSPALERTLLDARLPGASIHRIPNGVDLSRFTPQSHGERGGLRRDLGLPVDATIVLFVGMIAAVKRPDLLFDAWARVRTELGSCSALIFCTTRSAFGEIDSAIAEGIRTRAATLGVASDVKFVECAFDIERFYRAADIFVLPSDREGLPNALLEAMASGLPCIASSLPGITDVIVEDGVNGVLVPPGDVERLADALRAMAREPEHAHELGRRARQTIEAKYTIDVTAARHLDVYHSLVPTCEAGAKAC